MPAHQILVIATFVTAAGLLVVLLGSLVHRTPDDQLFWEV